MTTTTINDQMELIARLACIFGAHNAPSGVIELAIPTLVKACHILGQIAVKECNQRLTSLDMRNSVKQALVAQRSIELLQTVCKFEARVYNESLYAQYELTFTNDKEFETTVKV